VAPAFIQQHGEDAVLAEVQRGVDAANEAMARAEQIKKFKVLDAEWEPGGEELTPTMKLKRKPIHQKYATEIEELY
jgi:long-chain acyl-CoA synthetase